VLKNLHIQIKSNKWGRNSIYLIKFFFVSIVFAVWQFLPIPLIFRIFDVSEITFDIHQLLFLGLILILSSILQYLFFLKQSIILLIVLIFLFVVILIYNSLFQPQYFDIEDYFFDIERLIKFIIEILAGNNDPNCFRIA